MNTEHFANVYRAVQLAPDQFGRTEGGARPGDASARRTLLNPSTTHHRSQNYTRNTRHSIGQRQLHKFKQFRGHLHATEAICGVHLEAVPGVHFEAAASIQHRGPWILPW